MKMYIPALLSLALQISTPAQAQVKYRAIDLGTLAGPHYSSIAWAINNAGQVVGWSDSLAGGGRRGYIWANGVMTDLGALGDHGSIAYDINDSGQVVGLSEGPDGSVHAFLWENGVMRDLGVGQALGINNAGEVVGQSGSMGCLWRGGTCEYLYGVARAEAVNNLGEVVGNGPTGAVLWRNGSITVLAPPSTRGQPFDINDHGQVVGRMTVPGGYPRGFLWQDGTMLDLGTLPGGHRSQAFGINNLGQIVGWADTDEPGVSGRAFLWQNGVMTNLQTLLETGTQWSLRIAYAINDSGQIVGAGFPGPSAQHAFLLVPVFELPSPMLFALGIAAVASARRRRCSK